jgi:peptide-methionine (S)-S-oxide reductase
MSGLKGLHIVYAVIAVVVLVVSVVSLNGVTRPAAQARLVPPSAVDDPAGARTSDVAVVAGGCFWGVQAVYQHTKGVTRAVSGYAGGERRTAQYEMVGTGRTGHAEAVEITYDPRVITYGQLLQILFSVAHDPTELNRQGPDVGPQYRSTIFAMNDSQGRVARAYIDQLNQARVFDRAIATTIETGRAFYPAEDYHQDFLERNPTYPYIVIHDLPKLEDLKRMFPERYRATPALVFAAR